MTTSSAQTNCYTTLTKEQLDALSDLSSITLTTSGSSYYGPSYVMSTGTASSSCITYTTSTTSSNFCIPPINIGSINVWGTSEWVDSFPAWGRIEKMCEEYPGLKIAFEKFKTTYQLVKDDYDAPEHKKIRP